MKEKEPSQPLELVRHAAVTWIQEAEQNFTLARALSLASERLWGARYYSSSTLEDWYYLFRHEGFAGLKRKPRKDKGARKALSPEASQALLERRRQFPQMKVKVLVRKLLEEKVLEVGTFSMPSVYRLLAENGLDAQSMKKTSHLQDIPSGPTKSFECALPNELWMTDMMFGPALRLAEGRLVQTRLFALLDDCSRLVPHAQYYESEKLNSFLDCFRQGLARRGLP